MGWGLTLLGPYSLGSGGKLIKCPHAFKAKFDPISVTIPFQEPFISWMNTPRFISAGPGCPASQGLCAPSVWGSPGSSATWLSQPLLFQKRLLTVLLTTQFLSFHCTCHHISRPLESSPTGTLFWVGKPGTWSGEVTRTGMEDSPLREKLGLQDYFLAA